MAGRLVLAVAVAAANFGVVLPVPAAEPAIQPHKAAYSLRLVESRDRGSVAAAKGRVEFEWAAGCDGWTVNQRTLLIFSDADGHDLESGWTLSAWESNDGLTYRFAVKRLGSGETASVFRGGARLDGPGKGGFVTYSEPEERRRALPEGVRFPTRHSSELLAAAARGEFLIWRLVFDGTAEEGLFEVNAVITPPPASDAPASDLPPALRGLRSWQVQMAFFPHDEAGPEPDHEQILRLYANGVVDEMRFDYGDFVLAGSLERLEMLAVPKCG